jgi:hypothetical protein
MLLDEDHTRPPEPAGAPPEPAVAPLEHAVAPPERPYATMQTWLRHAGRDDLVDCVADEFERRRAVPAATTGPANY